jgi:hypothetical protein
MSLTKMISLINKNKKLTTMHPVANTTATIAQSVGLPEIDWIMRHVRTIQHATQVDAPKIQHILRTPDGFDRATTIIAYALSRYFRLAGIETIPTVEQTQIISEAIIDRYPMFTLVDINLMLRKGITGAYGPIYARIEMHTIAGSEGWCGQYYNTHYIERIRARNAAIETERRALLPAPASVPVPAPDNPDLDRKLEQQHRQFLLREITSLSHRKKIGKS